MRKRSFPCATRPFPVNNNTSRRFPHITLSHNSERRETQGRMEPDVSGAIPTATQSQPTASLQASQDAKRTVITMIPDSARGKCEPSATLNTSSQPSSCSTTSFGTHTNIPEADGSHSVLLTDRDRSHGTLGDGGATTVSQASPLRESRNNEFAQFVAVKK